jgi:hypothetical protein
MATSARSSAWPAVEPIDGIRRAFAAKAITPGGEDDISGRHEVWDFEAVAGVTKAGRQLSLIHPALACIAMGLLISCAEQPKPPPPPAPIVEEIPPPEHILVRRRHVPRPARKPEPPLAPPSEAEAVGEPASTAVEPVPVEPVPGMPAVTMPLQPSQLIGLDEAGAMRLFGAATTETAQPPAKVWRYAISSCELDLYFYYDLRSARMRTLRYSFKGEAADKEKEQACMDAIAAARRG